MYFLFFISRFFDPFFLPLSSFLVHWGVDEGRSTSSPHGSAMHWCCVSLKKLYINWLDSCTDGRIQQRPGVVLSVGKAPPNATRLKYSIVGTCRNHFAFYLISIASGDALKLTALVAARLFVFDAHSKTAVVRRARAAGDLRRTPETPPLIKSSPLIDHREANEHIYCVYSCNCHPVLVGTLTTLMTVYLFRTQKFANSGAVTNEIGLAIEQKQGSQIRIVDKGGTYSK